MDGAVVVNRVRQMKGKNDGYDAENGQYCDLVEAGIIDPAKVVRTALQNAASVASLLLTNVFAGHGYPQGGTSARPAATTMDTGWAAAWGHGRRHAGHDVKVF